ncbi:hypothetical protein GCM10027043_46510 [Ferruginibacter profundus]
MVNYELAAGGLSPQNSISNASFIYHPTIWYNKRINMYIITKKFIDQLAYEIIGAAIEVLNRSARDYWKVFIMLV